MNQDQLPVSPECREACVSVTSLICKAVTNRQDNLVAQSIKVTREVEAVVQQLLNTQLAKKDEELNHKEKEVKALDKACQEWASLVEQLNQQLSELKRDKERLDFVQLAHYTILACHNPKIFMTTSMGRPSGIHKSVREAIDSAIQAQTKGKK